MPHSRLIENAPFSFGTVSYGTELTPGDSFPEIHSNNYTGYGGTVERRNGLGALGIGPSGGTGFGESDDGNYGQFCGFACYEAGESSAGAGFGPKGSAATYYRDYEDDP